MHFQIISPSGILARYIQHYWMLEAGDNEQVATERVIPTGNIEWMFHYRNPFLVKSSSHETHIQQRGFASGINNSYSDVSTRGAAGVIAISFYPDGACQFLQMPLSLLGNSSVSLNDLLGSKTREIEEKIVLANGLAERIRIIESFLLSIYRPVVSHDSRLISDAVRIIKNAKGQIPSGKLSEILSFSQKSIERKFSEKVGTSPKQFCRIVRFQHVVKGLWVGNTGELTSLAYNNGYFDQSHFIRDFKAISGYTPGEFLSAYPCQPHESAIQ
jgi:AraC-like DNA-binding protein